MSENYRPVNDRTINDVNRANQDAWDSGEFKHTFVDPKKDFADEGDAVISSPVKAAETFGSAAASMARQGKPEAARVAVKAAHFGRAGLAEQAGHSTAKALSGKGDAQAEGATSAPKKSIHMPRTAKRTWRKGEWS